MHVDVKPSPVARATTPAYCEAPTSDAIDEAEVLRQEAECAKAAIGRKLNDLKDAALHAADPKVLARTHPWLTMGAAAAAGFAAASLVMPRKGERATNRIEQLLEKLQAAGPAVPPPTAPTAAAANPIWGTLFELAKTAATTFLLNSAQQNAAETQRAAEATESPSPTDEHATPASAAATDAAFL